MTQNLSSPSMGKFYLLNQNLSIFKSFSLPTFNYSDYFFINYDPMSSLIIRGTFMAIEVWNATNGTCIKTFNATKVSGVINSFRHAIVCN